jgi:hypothetical protein
VPVDEKLHDLSAVETNVNAQVPLLYTCMSGIEVYGGPHLLCMMAANLQALVRPPWRL